MAVESKIEKRSDGYYMINCYYTNHTGVVSIKVKEGAKVEEEDVLYTITRLGLIKNIKSTTYGIIKEINLEINNRFCGYHSRIIVLERKLTPEETQSYEEEREYGFVYAPQGGNYFINRSPGLPPFINIGDIVDKGSLVAICMVMKKRKEIIYEGERGKIAKIYFQNGQQCNEGDKLFGILLRPFVSQ
jgi:biotin carboxyl carrier protein